MPITTTKILIFFFQFKNNSMQTSNSFHPNRTNFPTHHDKLFYIVYITSYLSIELPCRIIDCNKKNEFHIFTSNNNISVHFRLVRYFLSVDLYACFVSHPEYLIGTRRHKPFLVQHCWVSRDWLRIELPFCYAIFRFFHLGSIIS